MTTDPLILATYAFPLVVIWWLYMRSRTREDRENFNVLAENIEAGLVEPASLHPVIDHNRCIGCGACVAACPEMPAHHVLGLVSRKATLVSPTDCIGHGACKSACPEDAIELVFGTDTRGVDIPNVGPDFQTNVQGIYVAGELGGMGLIRNAIEQGRQAIQSIARRMSGSTTGIVDVIIVGAGPTGIAASLAAQEQGLSYLTIEQDSLGGSVAHFPRRKLVMTAPATLPLVGNVKFTETSKEALIEFWQNVEQEHGLNISYGERVESVQRSGDAIRVVTSNATHQARALLLAIGRRGTPRQLGVPGEELEKVTYRLIDPAQYRDQHVLIVGGGDSAIESAVTISEEPGTTVTLSYRSAAFSRAKKKNRARLEAASTAGRVRVLLESNVRSIGEDYVEIDHKGTLARIPNDAVIVNAGGILPTAFLKDIGVEIDTKFGTA